MFVILPGPAKNVKTMLFLKQNYAPKLLIANFEMAYIVVSP